MPKLLREVRDALFRVFMKDQIAYINAAMFTTHLALRLLEEKGLLPADEFFRRLDALAGEFAKDPAKAQDAKALEYALQRQALFRQAVRIDQ